MANINSQSIPSEIRRQYDANLTPAVTIPTAVYVKKRPYFTAPGKQRRGTLAQKTVRARFKKCVRCFNTQPYSGGVLPPDIGARDRGFWYAEAESSGLWYYDYFIQQTMLQYKTGTPQWCATYAVGDAHTSTRQPNNNFGFLSLVSIGDISAGFLATDYYAYISPPQGGYYGISFAVLGLLGSLAAWETPLRVNFHHILESWSENTIKASNAPAITAVIATAIVDKTSFKRYIVTLPKINDFGIAISAHDATQNKGIQIASHDGGAAPLLRTYFLI